MTNNDDPVVLTSVSFETQAAIIVAVLQDGGIEAYSTGGLTSGWRAEAPGMVQVLVRQGDLERAQQLLDEAQEAEPPA